MGRGVGYCNYFDPFPTRLITEVIFLCPLPVRFASQYKAKIMRYLINFKWEKRFSLSNDNSEIITHFVVVWTVSRFLDASVFLLVTDLDTYYRIHIQSGQLSRFYDGQTYLQITSEIISACIRWSNLCPGSFMKTKAPFYFTETAKLTNLFWNVLSCVNFHNLKILNVELS